MRIFVAASYGHEEWLADIGVRNRLITYGEIDTTAIAGHRFWVAGRMKVFMAGNVIGEAAQRDDHAGGVTNRLLSFADKDTWGRAAVDFWVNHKPESACVFMDSGAYGAWSRGLHISIEKYVAYLHANTQGINYYASLDVVGDWKTSARNVEYMQQQGLNPIPTFHRGSPWLELDHLCRDHEYIALGGVVSAGQFSRGTLGPYLDEAWDHIGRYWPRKIHIFGVTTQWALERYPFYSADSASAIVSGGMGRVSTFDGGVLRSGDGAEYARLTYDGIVMDGIGRRDGNKSAHAGRRRRNIEAQLKLERHVTECWTARGVVWEDKGV